tara:strand:+ start:4675 stop:5373 length:699 start_codon:yes stop_codon:yes gene_type:complete
MASINLKHTSGNGTILNSPAANPSSDITLKLPSTTGSAGQVLKVASANHSATNAELEFGADTGGKLLQTVTVSDSVRETSGSVSLSSANTYYETPFAVTITPSATSSKILLMGHVFGEFSLDDYLFMWSIKRAISGGATTDIKAPAAGNRARGISIPPAGFYVSESSSTPTVMNFSGLVDSPSTTSAVTYTFQVNSTQSASQTFYYNRAVLDRDVIDDERGLSWITAQEIAA